MIGRCRRVLHGLNSVNLQTNILLHLLIGLHYLTYSFHKVLKLCYLETVLVSVLLKLLDHTLQSLLYLFLGIKLHRRLVPEVEIQLIQVSRQHLRHHFIILYAINESILENCMIFKQLRVDISGYMLGFSQLSL